MDQTRFVGCRILPGDVRRDGQQEAGDHDAKARAHTPFLTPPDADLQGAEARTFYGLIAGVLLGLSVGAANSLLDDAARVFEVVSEHDQAKRIRALALLATRSALFLATFIPGVILLRSAWRGQLSGRAYFVIAALLALTFGILGIAVGAAVELLRPAPPPAGP